MKLLKVCKGISKIGIDSVAFIYYIEDKNPYSELCQEVFLQIEAGQIVGFSSTLALTERNVSMVLKQISEVFFM